MKPALGSSRHSGAATFVEKDDDPGVVVRSRVERIDAEPRRAGSRGYAGHKVAGKRNRIRLLRPTVDPGLRVISPSQGGCPHHTDPRDDTVVFFRDGYKDDAIAVATAIHASVVTEPLDPKAFGGVDDAHVVVVIGKDYRDIRSADQEGANGTEEAPPDEEAPTSEPAAREAGSADLEPARGDDAV